MGSGSAPPADGRRGSAENANMARAKNAPREPRRAFDDQSCHGEKLWHQEAGIVRANGATRYRKPTPNDDAARRRERRVEARLG
jgi:hypothetical protein